MTTIATIAVEHNMQPHELAALLDLERGFDHEKEEVQNIIDLLEYDQAYSC